MIEIDARKLECPKPVLLVKEEADKGTAQIRACVDNEVAAGNVTRFFESRGYTASREDGAEGIYITGKRAAKPPRYKKRRGKHRDTLHLRQNRRSLRRPRRGAYEGIHRNADKDIHTAIGRGPDERGRKDGAAGGLDT